MKKFLWLLFAIMLVNKVEASEVFYSDYTDFSPYQEEMIEQDDCTNVIFEDRYLWYKNEQIIKDYIPYNKIDNFTNDCYLEEPSAWSTEKQENTAYVYETRTKYEYTKTKKARYIHLFDLQGSYGAFRITEMTIMINGQKLDYSFSCNGCWENFEQYINNGIYDENKSYIDNGGSLIIDLGKEYPLNQIEIVFYIFDLGPSEKLYTLGFADSNNNILVSKSYNLKFADQYWVNALKIETDIYDLQVDINDWTYSEVSYQNIEDDSVIATVVSEEYRYQVKWCRPYEIVKLYHSEYSKEAFDSYTIKDDSSKKTYYSYQTRDKLELDIFEINSKDFDLNDFIINSTGEVMISEDIDWNKNGNYDVTFKVNDLEVTKSVVLNVDSNTIKELNDEIEALNNQLKQLLADFERQVKEYEQKIADLNQKLNNCHFDSECLNKVIQEKDSLITVYTNKILDLSEQINQLQVTLDEEKTKVDILNTDNYELILKVKQLNSEIENLKINSSKLNQEIIEDYDKRISNLLNLNDFYKNKIVELEGDLRDLINSLSDALAKKDLLIDEYLDKIDILQEQLSIKDSQYQQIKKELKTTENTNLNSYILRINYRTVSYVFIFLLLLILIIYLIYRWRKSSK